MTTDDKYNIIEVNTKNNILKYQITTNSVLKSYQL